MEYFDLFEMPVSFFPDKNILKKKYFELSRKFHPDFFSNGSEYEKNNALEKSSVLNKAYKTFQDRDALIKYILTEKKLLHEEEKYNLPQDFLMEILELNERIADAKIEESESEMLNLKSEISNLQTEIYEPVKKILENYQEDISSEKELLQVKEYYFRKKYLDRILDGMQ